MQGIWKWIAPVGGAYLSARAVLASVAVGSGVPTWDGALQQLDVSLMPEKIWVTWDYSSMIDPLKKVQLHTACDDLGESLGLDKGCSYAQHVLVLSEESLVTSSGSMEAINSSTIQTAQRGTIGLNRTKSDLYLPDRNLHDIQGPIRQSVTVRMITKTAR